MDSSAYKEAHRAAMIKWSERIRDKDSGHFCRLAVQKAPPNKVWLVVDARRPTDMQFFKTHYEKGSNGPVAISTHSSGVSQNSRQPGKVLTVRVTASIAVRQQRGWRFVAGVDDAISECGLDDYQCDVTIRNDSNDRTTLSQELMLICQWIKPHLPLPPSLSQSSQ